jgi:hypothetical protein
MSYPVTFEADYVERRNRASNFFRYILAIPLIFWWWVWAIAVDIVVIIAWFALLFTGHYPQWMYDFVGKYVRFASRVWAYVSFMTDRYPSFGGRDDADYPVRVHIAPPLPKYGRWRVFLRLPIALLAYFVALVVMYLSYPVLLALSFAPAVNWLVIINDGRARLSLHRLTWLYIEFWVRLLAWGLLMTQDFPPFLGEWSRTAGTPGTAIPPEPEYPSVS